MRITDAGGGRRMLRMSREEWAALSTKCPGANSLLPKAHFAQRQTPLWPQRWQNQQNCELETW